MRRKNGGRSKKEVREKEERGMVEVCVGNLWEGGRDREKYGKMKKYIHYTLLYIAFYKV